MPIRFALDVFKAGVNPWGIMTGNKGDVQKLGEYYGADANQGQLNELPLDSQLFMRYLSGRGSQGLTIDKDRGEAIYESIMDQKQNLSSKATREKLRHRLGDSHYQRVMQGHIPIYYSGMSDTKEPWQNKLLTIPHDQPYRNELRNSLGSFWATPNDDGSYDIQETYNFGYAPSSKGGDDLVRDRAKSALSGFLVDPSNIGRRIVTQGAGKPYDYKLRVSPDGTVLVNPD